MEEPPSWVATASNTIASDLQDPRPIPRPTRHEASPTVGCTKAASPLPVDRPLQSLKLARDLVVCVFSPPVLDLQGLSVSWVVG